MNIKESYDIFVSWIPKNRSWKIQISKPLITSSSGEYTTLCFSLSYFISFLIWASKFFCCSLESLRLLSKCWAKSTESWWKNGPRSSTSTMLGRIVCSICFLCTVSKSSWMTDFDSLLTELVNELQPHEKCLHYCIITYSFNRVVGKLTSMTGHYATNKAIASNIENKLCRCQSNRLR